MEVVCSQSIILGEESRRIKVSSCHCRDVRQIPADLVNTTARPCVRCLPSVSLRLSAPPFALFFNLLLTFVSHSSSVVELKRAINQTACETHKLRVPGPCWFKRIVFFLVHILTDKGELGEWRPMERGTA